LTNIVLLSPEIDGLNHYATATEVRPLSHRERVGVRGYALSDRP
jgi:hypothetical protein